MDQRPHSLAVAQAMDAMAYKFEGMCYEDAIKEVTRRHKGLCMCL